MKLNIKPPVKQPRVVVQGFSLRPEHKARIEKLAKHYGVNKSQVVQAMIDEAYTALPQSAKRAKV